MRADGDDTQKEGKIGLQNCGLAEPPQRDAPRLRVTPPSFQEFDLIERGRPRIALHQRAQNL